MGYKNMCRFWSVGFLEVFEDYKYVIGIDEDVLLQRLDGDIIEKYIRAGVHFGYAHLTSDDQSLIVGLYDFIQSYLKKHNITPHAKLENMHPYTNFMIFDIDYITNNKAIIDILREVDNTVCIFINRWGDLPMWGFTLQALVPSNHRKHDKTIQYRHGFHAVHINIGT